MARAKLDRAVQARSEAAIDRWADSFAMQGWPPGTPRYLIESYWAMLDRRRMPRRLAWLVDDAFELRALDMTQSRQHVIEATEAGLRLYEDDGLVEGDEDIGTICTLGLRRAELLDATAAIPPEVVAGWAALGAWDEVDRLLGQMPAGPDLDAAICAAARAAVPGVAYARMEPQIQRSGRWLLMGRVFVATYAGTEVPPTVIDALFQQVRAAGEPDANDSEGLEMFLDLVRIAVGAGDRSGSLDETEAFARSLPQSSARSLALALVADAVVTRQPDRAAVLAGLAIEDVGDLALADQTAVQLDVVSLLADSARDASRRLAESMAERLDEPATRARALSRLIATTTITADQVERMTDAVLQLLEPIDDVDRTSLALLDLAVAVEPHDPGRATEALDAATANAARIGDTWARSERQLWIVRALTTFGPTDASTTGWPAARWRSRRGRCSALVWGASGSTRRWCSPAACSGWP